MAKPDTQDSSDSKKAPPYKGWKKGQTVNLEMSPRCVGKPSFLENLESQELRCAWDVKGHKDLPLH